MMIIWVVECLQNIDGESHCFNYPIRSFTTEDAANEYCDTQSTEYVDSDNGIGSEMMFYVTPLVLEGENETTH